MEKRKSLGRLLLDTAVVTVITYPVYSALSALIYNSSFIDKLKDPKTLAIVAGLGIGHLVFNGAKEIRYRIRSQ